MGHSKPAGASRPPSMQGMAAGRAMLAGPAHEALREAAAAVNVAERYQQPLEMSLALAQMARCYRALQALGPARLCLERALAWARLLGAADQAVEVLCLLAETSCSVAELRVRDDGDSSDAALERTREWAFEAERLATHVADPQWEIKVLLRISDVYDRCGDHDDAVELQSRAMRLMYGPHAAEAAFEGATMQMPADA